jgi:hypothetical protein
VVRTQTNNKQIFKKRNLLKLASSGQKEKKHLIIFAVKTCVGEKILELNVIIGIF